jgi:pseudouridylate synthase
MQSEQFPFTIRLRQKSGNLNHMSQPPSLRYFASSLFDSALHSSLPIVALESTVITHGLPRPQNLELAHDMEHVVRENGATPATIAVLDGKIHIGLTNAELERLANEDNVRKISRRDFATAILKKECGGTTVAATMFAAHRAGIKVLATGGIGGVHDLATFDISTDLQSLADTPMLVVCAGAKAILDLPSTLEYLETMGVPVIGYRTAEFPAFFSRQSGLPVTARVDTPQEVVDFAKTHWELGLSSAVLVCQPLSKDEEIPQEKMAGAILQVRELANAQNIHGQQLTPFLLSRLSELTAGRSVKANLALLKNNAILAAHIARAWSSNQDSRMI